MKKLILNTSLTISTLLIVGPTFAGDRLAAAQAGNMDAIKILLDPSGSEGLSLTAIDRQQIVNHRTYPTQRTPLHSAAYKKDLGCAQSLIEAGADINARCSRNNTPLHTAAEVGAVEMVKLLLDRGANIEAQNQNGTTPLFKAVLNEKYGVIRLLLERGARIGNDYADTNGNTLLHTAAGKNNIELLTMLLQHKQGIEIRNNNGNTPLHRAAHYGAAEAVKLLIEAGADVNAINGMFQPESVLDVVEPTQTNYPSIVHMLLAAGADPMIQNNIIALTQAGADPMIQNNIIALTQARRSNNPVVFNLLTLFAIHNGKTEEDKKNRIQAIRADIVQFPQNQGFSFLLTNLFLSLIESLPKEQLNAIQRTIAKQPTIQIESLPKEQINAIQRTITTQQTELLLFNLYVLFGIELLKTKGNMLSLLASNLQGILSDQSIKRLCKFILAIQPLGSLQITCLKKIITQNIQVPKELAPQLKDILRECGADVEEFPDDEEFPQSQYTIQ